VNQLKRLGNFIVAKLGHITTDLFEAEVALGSSMFIGGLKIATTSGIPEVAQVAGVISSVVGPVIVLISRSIDMLTKLKLALKTPTIYTVTATSGSAVSVEGQVATVVGDIKKAVDAKSTPPAKP